MRCWALAALSLVAGAASAQVPFPEAPLIDTSLELVMEEPAGRIRPLGPFQAIRLEVHYRFLEAAPESDATPVTLSVAEQPPWTVVTISPSTLYIPHGTPCGCERDVVQEAFVLVSVTAEAPAFRAAEVRIRAEAAATGAYKASSAEGGVPVTADYFAILEVTAPQRIFRLDLGERVDVAATVVFFGNGASTISFSGVQAPGSIELALPASFPLGARQQDGENTRDIVIGARVVSPFLTSHANIIVRATSSELPGAGEEDSTVLSLLFEPEPSAWPGASQARLPGPGLNLLGPALLVGALVRRAACAKVM